jgi:hypothetical protein
MIGAYEQNTLAILPAPPGDRQATKRAQPGAAHPVPERERVKRLGHALIA